jgi:hypothetical protein
VGVGVSGSGFTPAELVFAQIPAPGGLAGFAEATVAPDGTVSATIEHVFPVAGFRSGTPIFGHFQSGGKVVLTYKFGKASGPCGILHAKSRHASANAKFKVQFDDSKKLSKKASPKIVTGLGSTF